jgi:hypothetical protein
VRQDCGQLPLYRGRIIILCSFYGLRGDKLISAAPNITSACLRKERVVGASAAAICSDWMVIYA